MCNFEPGLDHDLSDYTTITDIRALELLTSLFPLNFSQSSTELPKHLNRPKWYSRCIQPISDKKHKCARCGCPGWLLTVSCLTSHVISNTKNQNIVNKIKHGKKYREGHNLNFHLSWVMLNLTNFLKKHNQILISYKANL